MRKSSPLESSIVRNIIKKANTRPRCYARKLHGNMYQAGMPDVLICQDGQLLMVEAKRPGNKATPLQLAELNRWGAAGAHIMIAYGWPEVEDMLDAMLEGY